MDVSYPLNGEDNGEAGHKVESPVVHSEDRDVSEARTSVTTDVLS